MMIGNFQLQTVLSSSATCFLMCLGLYMFYTPAVFSQEDNLPPTSEYYPTSTSVDHDWKCVSITPLPTPGISQQDFSHYIHHPYSNPDLIQDNKMMQEYQNQAKVTDMQSENPEYYDNMNAICSNFYRAKRMENFHVMDQTVYHRKIMSFQRFAEACENYEKNNKLIWSGLNTDD